MIPWPLMGKGHRKGWKKAQRKMADKLAKECVPNVQPPSRPRDNSKGFQPRLPPYENTLLPVRPTSFQMFLKRIKLWHRFHFHSTNKIVSFPMAKVRTWIGSQLRASLRYLAESPSPDSRNRHKNIVLGIVATAVFALVPMWYQLMNSHPCGAWLSFTLALMFGAYSFWSITPVSRWARTVTLVIITSVFLVYGRQSIYSATQLDFFFVNPGVFLVQDRGEWLLMVTGQNTHKSLFNVQMILQDVVTAHAIPNEPDLAKREAMIRGGTIEKTYPEIGPTFLGDNIQWRPIDVNNQEYSVQARYRIGDRAFLSTEEIRIVNVGSRFVTAQQMKEAPTWAFSVTLRNQSGAILMHCVDPTFPHDARWIAGSACFPGAKYEPLPRSLCARCFARGFEFYP